MATAYGHMNNPPEVFFSVPAADLQGFVSAMGKASGLAEELAQLLARLLVGNDLRGNFSHGSVQIARYARLIRDGVVNGAPCVTVVKETPLSVLVDGDGGLGYFPAHRAAQQVIDKAGARGMAVGVTRNHGHIGAAGIYARMTLGHDLLGFVTSGVQLNLQPGRPLYSAGGGSPMAFSAPAGIEPPLLLDFGTLHDLYGSDPHRDEIASLTPGLVLRCIGLGEVCQTWGGLLSGLSGAPRQRPWTFAGANQGAMIVAMRIDLIDDPVRFKAQMDEYVRRVQQLKPLPGFDRAYAAGGREEALRKRYERNGIPIGPKHQEALEQAGTEFGVPVPWPSD